MVTITADRLTKVFGDTVAVDEVSIEIASGEVVALLGPTGCGKSTILRLIAGLERPTSGHVLIDGKPMDEVPVRDRRLAMVFQDYALYPHLTVAQNIGFPLQADPDPELDESTRVAEVADQLGIVDLLRRRPKQLSGGQRQRVAMARAIVRRPGAFLLDEPLSNVDIGLRAELRAEVATLARRLGVTTLYVTHDQTEAMSMADRVAVLRRGALQQVAAPAELYADPRTLFVAAFLGTPRPSLLQGAVYAEPKRVVVDLGSQLIELPRDDARFGALARWHTQRVTVVVRAESLVPVDAAAAPGVTLRGVVRTVENLGHEALVHVDAGATPTPVAQSRLEHPDSGRHLSEVLAERPRTGRPLRETLARMISPRRSDETPATARTAYGFYPVYEPQSPDDPPTTGDLVVRVPAPGLVRPGEPMTLALDPAQLLLFDRAGDRIRLD